MIYMLTLPPQMTGYWMVIRAGISYYWAISGIYLANYLYTSCILYCVQNIITCWIMNKLALGQEKRSTKHTSTRLLRMTKLTLWIHSKISEIKTKHTIQYKNVHQNQKGWPHRFPRIIPVDFWKLIPKLNIFFWNYMSKHFKKIPHTGDKESLDRCG